MVLIYSAERARVLFIYTHTPTNIFRLAPRAAAPRPGVFMCAKSQAQALWFIHSNLRVTFSLKMKAAQPHFLWGMAWKEIKYSARSKAATPWTQDEAESHELCHKIIHLAVCTRFLGLCMEINVCSTKKHQVYISLRAVSQFFRIRLTIF